jgi:hypothetical protein
MKLSIYKKGALLIVVNRPIANVECKSFDWKITIADEGGEK